MAKKYNKSYKPKVPRTFIGTVILASLIFLVVGCNFGPVHYKGFLP